MEFNRKFYHSPYCKRVFPGTFGDVGAKYKNKYRSLTYNIKDPKNDGLFRRIATRDLSPIEVISFVKNVCSNMVRFILCVQFASIKFIAQASSATTHFQILELGSRVL